ncbi:MAG: AI-2E family transporter [Rhizomicrobium sp.]|jgi:predicted PurR-regulated permease PerM
MEHKVHHSAPHSSETPSRPELQSAFYGAALAAIIVAAIYLGQPILMPAALAVLLAFALAPVAERLRRLHLGHVPSVLLTVLFAFLIIGALGAYIGSEFAHLAGDLPRYQTNLSHKIDSIRGAAHGNGLIARASAMLDQLDNEFTGAVETANTATQAAEKPTLVEIKQDDGGPLHIVQAIAGPLLAPLATATIVIIFVIFILLQKEDLRDRFIRLAGAHDLRRTTIALDDAANRLSRYLLIQTAINTCFGIIIGTGLWLIGIPNAGLWGLIATMFRFVPYIGVPLAAVLPVALAVAIDPGWGKVAMTAGLYAVVESLTGQAVEPVLYGRSTGLSATAILVAATFWTWVWGPVGLLLSTPLTMCLVVVGRHVEHLRFLDVLLGDKPALGHEESLYLRLLQGDPDEAANHAEVYLKEKPLAAYYDEVVLKALTLAQHDIQRGALDSERRHRVRETLQGLLHNLSEHGAHLIAAEAAMLELPEDWKSEPILCVAGHSDFDEWAGLLLVDLLRRQGLGGRVVSNADAMPSNIHHLEDAGFKIVCVSYLEPANYTNARYLVRRLRKRFAAMQPMLGFWGFTHDDSRYLDAIEATECDVVVTSLREAVERIVAIAVRKQPPAEARDELVA